jgi:hypothetical protein
MENKKDYTVTLLLSFFLGGLGIHRFYTGHIGLGVLQLLTFGGCGIWSLIDFIRICFNNFKTGDGQELDKPNLQLGKIFFFVWVALFVLGMLFQGASVLALFAGTGV